MTSDTSDYLYNKIAVLEKMLGADAEQARCEVEVGKATGRHKHSDYQFFAEIQIKPPRGKRLVARNSEPTTNAAIDRAKEEMKRQLRTYKSERKSIVRRDAAKAKRINRSRV